MPHPEIDFAVLVGMRFFNFGENRTFRLPERIQDPVHSIGEKIWFLIDKLRNVKKQATVSFIFFT